MCQEKEKMSKLSTALCTIGGIVVGTTAIRTFLAITNASDLDRKTLLRGTTSFVLSNPSHNNTSNELDSYEQDTALYKWAYDAERYDLRSKIKATSHGMDSSNFTLFNPDMANDGANSSTFTRRRALINATSPESLTSNSTHPHAGNETANHTHPRKNLFDENGFRLRLYWEHGYYWQEKTDERWWCMSCGDDGICKKNDVMRLRNCKDKSDLDARFNVISQKRGDQLRVFGTDLCLQKRGKSRHILLKPCKNKPLQWFSGLRQNGESFELRPSRFANHCLSNHHHPKIGEVVYAESCHLAHKADTGYWVAY